MPQRFLRPGITNSERWNSVSFQCQSFYIRILTHVDDYGRFDGRPAVIHGHCFSVWNEQNPTQQITLPQVEQMLQQLVSELLIEWYEQDEKKVVQFVQWQERIRENTRSKWPERTELAASCCKLLPPSPPPSPSSPPSPDAGVVKKLLQVKSPNMTRLEKLWGRRATTRWSSNELKSLAAIEPIQEDDFRDIEKFYSAKIPKKDDFRRHDLITLLNNWNGEVDRARKFKPANCL